MQMLKRGYRKNSVALALALSQLIGTVALAQTAPSSDMRAALLKGAEGLPLYFTMPERAYADLPPSLDSALIDFVHPASRTSLNKAGLRLMPVRRKKVGASLAQNGFLQTGDVVLSFREEWGGTGPYPNIQMGISHAGMIYVQNGQAYNIDNPLTGEYIGQLNTHHYNEAKLLHVMRPRNLTAKQQDNLRAWAQSLVSKQSQIWNSKLSFNSDYSAPKYDPNASKPFDFVQRLGAIGLGLPTGATSMYCSELVWSLLSLRDCDMVADKNSFASSTLPSCIDPIFAPMPALGTYMDQKTPQSTAGLAEGPLLMLESLNLPTAERSSMVDSIFATTDRMNNISSGHRAVAEAMAPQFAPLKNYYLGVGSDSPQIAALKSAFNAGMKENYSPTAFAINAMLPENNDTRAFDYVGTIVFID